jgi:hypothetical protein
MFGLAGGHGPIVILGFRMLMFGLAGGHGPIVILEITNIFSLFQKI